MAIIYDLIYGYNIWFNICVWYNNPIYVIIHYVIWCLYDAYMMLIWCLYDANVWCLGQLLVSIVFTSPVYYEHLCISIYSNLLILVKPNWKRCFFSISCTCMSFALFVNISTLWSK